jgi:hypothetical protein
MISPVLSTATRSANYSNASTDAPTGRLELVHIVCLGLAIWLFNHAYVGIDIHDAKLYAVLAAHWLDPAAYARDPFFLFGSQDDFSVFSPVYGTLVRWLGLDIAAKLVVITGASLLAIATTAISVKLFSSSWARALAVMLCAAAAYAYSPANILSFRINEEFATARSIAVPLGLLAMALCLHLKFRAGLATAILATLVHPLMGIWPFLAIVCVKFRDRTLLLSIGAGIAIVAGLTWLDMPAFQPLDAEWDRLMRPLSVVYVGTWPNIHLGSFMFWVALLLLAGHHGQPSHRRWYHIVALLGTAGLLSAQFASYFYPIKLVLQVQPWRAMWLAIFFALFAAVELFEGASRRGKRAVLWFLLGTLLIYLAHDLAGYILFACWLAIQSAIVHRITRNINCHPLASDRNLAILLMILTAVALPSYSLDLQQLANGLPLRMEFLPSALSGAFLVGGIGPGFLLIALSAAPWLGRRWLTLPLAALLVFALLNWDQRSPATRTWESSLLKRGTQNDMAQHIRRGEVVYWHENAPMRTWLELGTANYASGIQPAGSIFSREKTFEMKRRLERIYVASMLNPVPTGITERSRVPANPDQTGLSQAPRNIFSTMEISAPTGPGIYYLCQDPMLDWVVSSRSYTNNELMPIRTIDGFSGNSRFLYRCPRHPISLASTLTPLRPVATPN